jgi:hypothetical protein
MPTNKITLVLGDIFTIAIITLIGFSFHGEAGISFIPRMATTFMPLLVGWFLIAPWLGLFKEQEISIPKNLWRILLAIFFTAPLAAILRSALLHSAALPIFALVLGGTSGFGMLVWRIIYTLTSRFNKK